jgi:polyisoprenoid-binding protein YceI
MTIAIYRINPKQGRFVVQAFAEGLLSAFGHSPEFAVSDFSGEIQLDHDSPEQSSLSLKVNTRSLRLKDQVNEKDRREIERAMHDEVLETSRYPEITFISSSVSSERVFEGMYRVKVRGDLTLHGVTRERTIEGQVTLSEVVLRANGESRVRQSDFGIRKVSVAGGTLRVKDEVKLSFDLIAENA